MLQAEYFWLLHRHKDAPPTVSGGELILEMPWTVDDDHLAPIAYRPSARTAPHRQSCYAVPESWDPGAVEDGLYEGRVNAGYFTAGPASTKPGYAFGPRPRT